MKANMQIALLAALCLGLALVPLSGSTYLVYLATQILIFILFATASICWWVMGG